MKFLPKLRFIRLAVCLCLLLSFNANYAQVLTARYNTKMIAKVNGFYEYLPQGYSATGTTLYPVIISLMGYGEMGDGGTNIDTGLPQIITRALPKYIKSGHFPVSFTIPGTTKTYKFIVIAPQFQDPNHAPYPTPLDLDSVITYVVNHYKVDKTRIYLTGYSGGGGMIWDYTGYSIAFANRVAAVLPISAGTNDSMATKARTLTQANLPVWATHNDQDPVVSVALTYRWVDSINKAPSPNPLARKTIFHNTIHDAWTRTYDTSFKESISGYYYNVYQWMLRYQRIAFWASATSNSPVCVNTTLQLSANSVSGATYKWTGPNGFTSTSRTPSLSSPTTAATGTYKVTITKNGLSKSAYTSVTITTSATKFYRDADGDGYGTTSVTTTACSKPAGYVTKSGDCNDNDKTVYPGAKEICDGKDNDCDGLIDESCTTASAMENNALTIQEAADQLLVRMYPNPSYTYFTLKIESNSNNLLQVRVLDAVGKTVEVRSNMVKGSLTLGQSYKPGMYYVEVIQGNQRAIVKCIKQAQ